MYARRPRQGNDVLQQRIWRMLHLEADPLDERSSSRFRLRLRDGDDEFFRENLMQVGMCVCVCGVELSMMAP